MGDWTVAELVEDYKAGRVSRRRFVTVLLAAGISMPLISTILASCGGSNKNTGSNNAATSAAGAKPSVVTGTTASGTAAAGGAAATAAGTKAADAFTPTKRGGGGPLKLLWWQAVSILNPHLSGGTKEKDGASLFLEPLARFDGDGNMVPILATEVPSVEKGTLDKGGKSVTWKLKKGVTWHDGMPFTADDVVFTFNWIADPDTAALVAQAYKNVDTVEKVDDLTVKVTFKTPTLQWASAFVGNNGMILPQHVYSAYKGKEARNAPANLKPVGTGPYKINEFRPNDTIIADINDKYHVDNRPFFDRVEMKGGGDAPGAARAVLQTGEYDYAWNLQVDAPILLSLEKGGAGQIINYNGGSIEHMQLNQTDPNIETDGEKSSIKNPHPFLSDLKVRQAFSLAMDRKTIVEQLYLPKENVANYFAYTPKKYVPDGKFQRDIPKANQLLDDAGWKKGGDGVRTKDGKRMKVLYQTSVNGLRQQEQAIIKKDLESIGVEVELKTVSADVFFGADPANPDNYPHFYADIQMFTTTRDAPDDLLTFMQQYHSTEIAQKSNNWSGNNRARYKNPAFDALYDQALNELDPVKAADIFKKMNQLLIDDAALVPLVARDLVRAAKKGLQGMNLSGWESDLWYLPYWHRV